MRKIVRMLIWLRLANDSMKEIMEIVEEVSVNGRRQRASKDACIRLFSAPEIHRLEKLKKGKHRYYELPLTLAAQEATWGLGASYYTVFAADTRGILCYGSTQLISVHNQYFLMECKEGEFGFYFAHTPITQEEFDSYRYKEELYSRYSPIQFREKILQQAFTFQSEFVAEFREELRKNS